MFYCINQDDCCSSFKGIITWKDSALSQVNVELGPYPHTIVRHGAGSDADEFKFDFECTDTVCFNGIYFHKDLSRNMYDDQ